MNWERVVQRLIARRSIDDRGCWIWNGWKNSEGYGSICLFDSKRRKRKKWTEYVHRVSLCVFCGFNLNSRKDVHHKCDNPSCFNPEHLEATSRSKNIAATYAPDRRALRSKPLTPTQVDRLRSFLRHGGNLAAWARGNHVRYCVAYAAAVGIRKHDGAAVKPLRRIKRPKPFVRRETVDAVIRDAIPPDIPF